MASTVLFGARTPWASSVSESERPGGASRSRMSMARSTDRTVMSVQDLELGSQS
jgi:hypothetical protein